MRHIPEFISMMLLVNGAFLCLSPRLTDYVALNFIPTTLKNGAVILDGLQHFIGSLMILQSLKFWYIILSRRSAIWGAAGVILSIFVGMKVSSYFSVAASSVSLKANAKSNLTLFLQGYKVAPDLRKACDKVQSTLTSCDEDGYRDWDKWVITAPLSCCTKEVEEEEDRCSLDSLYRRDCLSSILWGLLKRCLLIVAMNFLTVLNLAAMLVMLEDAWPARGSWIVSQR